MKEAARMRKKLSGGERRGYIDKLLERYAAHVWQSVTERYVDTLEAEEVFLQVFVIAIFRLTRDEANTLSDEFIDVCMDEVERSVVPHRLLEGPIEDEEESRAESDADDEAPSEPSTDENEGQNQSLPNQTDRIQIPIALIARTVQVLRANIAMREALEYHRGPRWTRVGVVVLAALGIGSALYGGSTELMAYVHPKLPVSTVQSSEHPNVARSVGNLPVTPVAVYQLSTASAVDLTHVAVGSNGVFFGQLQQPANSWPRITAYSEAFAMGKTLKVTDGRPYTMELVPPQAHAGSTNTTDSAWSIDKWSIATMREWLVAVVTWSDSQHNADQIVQIYAMNRSNGKYSIVKTITPEKGVSNEAVVAVGNGEIATQRALSTIPGEVPLGLPIQIYSLTGTDPLRALTPGQPIPASFGLMQSPVITTNGLMFQGVAGKNETVDDNTAIWYALSPDGTLSKYFGPPIDGQAHWGVQGTSGSLWWVETTPDSSDDSEMQLLMAPLATTRASVAAKSLDKPIEQFGVSGSYLAWVEKSGINVQELVIAQVQ